MGSKRSKRNKGELTAQNIVQKVDDLIAPRQEVFNRTGRYVAGYPEHWIQGRLAFQDYRAGTAAEFRVLRVEVVTIKTHRVARISTVDASGAPRVFLSSAVSRVLGSLDPADRERIWYTRGALLVPAWNQPGQLIAVDPPAGEPTTWHVISVAIEGQQWLALPDGDGIGYG